MDVVGARFDENVGHGTGGAPKFGVEIRGGNVHRLDRFDWRNQHLQQAGALVVVDAFNLVVVAHPHLAVDFRLQGARGIEELGVLERGAGCAGNQIQQVLEVPVGADGQILGLNGLDLAAGIGAVGLQRRRRVGNLDGFADVAGRESQVDTGAGVNDNVHVAADFALEARSLRSERIPAGSGVGEHEVAALVCLGVAGIVCCGFGCSDFRVGDDGTGGIDDRAQDGRVDGLGVYGRSSNCSHRQQGEDWT